MLLAPPTGLTYTVINSPSSIPVDETSCVFENQIFMDGEEWRPDTCTRCSCVMGNVLCDAECTDLLCKSEKCLSGAPTGAALLIPAPPQPIAMLKGPPPGPRGERGEPG